MNIDNINRVIAAVRAEPHHFVMKDWNTAGGDSGPAVRLTLARNNPCNTAGCLGGWMDSLALADIQDGKMIAPEGDAYGHVCPMELAGQFIGIKHYLMDHLFHMDREYVMSRFDRLPPKARAEAGARALEIFRDSNGKSDWTQALRETGLLEYMRGGEITIDGQTYR